MPYFHSFDGSRLAYQTFGQGQDLVLIHGGWMDRSSWDEVIPYLEDDFKVWSVDRRGHGDSDPYLAGHTFQIEFQDFAAFFEFIGEPLFVAGHSAGAHLGVHAADETSNITKLVLYEPPYFKIELTGVEKLQQVIDRGEFKLAVMAIMREVVGASTGRRMSDEELDKLLDSRLGRMMIRNAKSMAVELGSYATYHLDVERFRSFQTPTLFLLGGKSPPFNRIVTDKLHAAIPHSRIEMLEGQGHGAMFEAPELLAGVIRSFFLGKDYRGHPNPAG